MGDWYAKVIPKEVERDEVDSYARMVVNYLLSKRVIRSELKDNTLGGGGQMGYPPGDNWQYATEYKKENHFLTLWTNGLEVVRGRTVFFDSYGVDAINCPLCGHNCIDNEWNHLITAWWEDKGRGHDLACENCGHTASITEYDFDPVWAFGELGFTFWNWPILSNDFINELEELINKEIVVIYGKV